MTLMETPVEIILPLLGERRYLQGSTLFDALLPYVPQPCKLSFRIPRLIESDRIKVLPVQEPRATGKEFSAFLSWEDRTGHGVLGVNGLSPSKIPRRIPYDESQVTDSARFCARGVRFDGPSPFSFSATIVSLNKAMLVRELPKQERGRWLFVRLDLADVPKDTKEISLDLEAVLSGGRMVKTGVGVMGSLIGDLYFSWWVGE